MKTVRVRIAVAITPDGLWACAGNWDAPDDELMSFAIDRLYCQQQEADYYWIEADVPVPTTNVIIGEVKNAS